MNDDDHQRPILRAPLAALPCLVMALFAGCDVRDEEAREGSTSPWPPQVVERLTTPTQRAQVLPATSQTIDFVDGYAAASRRATEAGLPMLLVFRASWCRWSQTFMGEVTTDSQLLGLAGRFVCVSVDADREQATCNSFGVQAFPTVIVLDRERRETFRATGAAARVGLAVAVRSILEDPARRVAGRPATTSR